MGEGYRADPGLELPGPSWKEHGNIQESHAHDGNGSTCGPPSVTGPERDELCARQVERRPGFAEDENKTTLKIPVLALEPVTEGQTA